MASHPKVRRTYLCMSRTLPRRSGHSPRGRARNRSRMEESCLSESPLRASDVRERSARPCRPPGGPHDRVRDMPIRDLKHNVVGLAKAAKILKLPIVVTTTARDWAKLVGQMAQSYGK